MQSTQDIYRGITFDPEHVRLLERQATSPRIPLLITGETGTGKEEIANLLCRIKSRNEGREISFVAINCASLERDLAEATLFGHEKGAFTGASANRQGLVEMARDGILFLDEVHSLDIRIQQKLLRFLNNGSYYPVGSNHPKQVDFQLVVATNINIDTAVSEGKFLQDLRYRLFGRSIELRPLRQRQHEFMQIFENYLKNKNVILPQKCKEAAVEQLKKYPWHGNFRELNRTLDVWYEDTKETSEHPFCGEIPVYLGLQSYGVKAESEKNCSKISKLLQTISLEVSDAMENKSDYYTLLAVFEKNILSHYLSESPTVKETSENLRLSRSSLDLKRAAFGLKEIEPNSVKTLKRAN